jgi:hypothetical protein
MKVRLNKNVLSDMPEPVRVIVQEWRDRYRKVHVSVVNCDRFMPSEDSKVAVINLFTGNSLTVRTAGDFAGMTKLSPCAVVPLPEGCVAVETGFFMGQPWLSIYQSGLTKAVSGV